MVTKKNTGGRPSKFKPEFVEQAAKLCSLGATDEDLADFFKVSIRTIAYWKANNDGFLQALKAGKTQADDRVERSLYQRAVGYTFDAVHFSSYQGNVKRTTYREHVAPDVTAQIFWLKNRRPDEWRDRQQQEFSGKIELQTVSDTDRAKALALFLARAKKGET